MKKLFSLLLSVVMVVSVSVPSFAVEAENTSSPDHPIKFLPSDVTEITDEIIAEYGIVSTDENGDTVVTIPLAPSNNFTCTPASDSNPDVDETGLVHDGHHIPEGIVMPYHFSGIRHTHRVTDVRTSTLSTYEPVTAYANGGVTITKEYSKSITFSVGLSLSGGITKDDVEAALNVTVGAEYTVGESESYSATVPEGKIGRLVYFYHCTVYRFTNETTYWWDGLEPTYEYDDCYAEGAPYDGYFGLQFKI